MKKAFILMCLAAGLLSCAKETVPQEETKGVPMTFEFSVDGQTKASKTAWTDIDVIYVFFKGIEGKFLILNYDSATQEWWSYIEPGDASLTDTDFEGLDHTLTAVYLPTPVYVTTDTPGQFTITKDGENPFYGFYLFQEGKAYEIDGTTVKAGLSLEKPEDFIQIHIPCAPNEVGGTFGCSLIQPVACTGVGVNGKIVEKELQVGARLTDIADVDDLVFAGRLTNPGAAADYTFTFAKDEKIYTLTRESKRLEGGKQYNFPALTEIGGTNWTVTDAADLYVDLGLTVKWAKCNLGASEPIYSGNHFSWGELVQMPESSFSWESYYFNPSGDGMTFTKYTGSDYSTLRREDDAAYAALGGKFRMPTAAEWYELLTECDWEWESDISIGWEVTGPSGDSIFLRADGYMGEGGFNTGCGYWSSSLNTEGSPSEAWVFTSDYSKDQQMVSVHRHCGYSVRPVHADS